MNGENQAQLLVIFVQCYTIMMLKLLEEIFRRIVSHWLEKYAIICRVFIINSNIFYTLLLFLDDPVRALFIYPNACGIVHWITELPKSFMNGIVCNAKCFINMLVYEDLVVYIWTFQ